MKELKFKTSKGEFLVVDYEAQSNNWIINTDWFIKLSEITEDQASEIVCNALFEINYKDYTFIPTLENTYAGEFRLNSAIESLHSLLKSKGIHLFDNPYKYTKTEDEERADKMTMCRFLTKEETQSYREETKTFYNPYIFKL